MARYLDLDYATATMTTIEYTSGFSADIFTPDGDSGIDRACVLCFPSGAATRETMHQWAEDEWALRGYVGVAADVKTTPGQLTEAEQLASFKRILILLDYLRDNNTTYGISKYKFFLMGLSAGAILALQAGNALNNREEAYFSGAISIPKIKVLATATLAGASTAIYQAMIDKTDPPNHFYHGEDDNTVEYDDAVATHAIFLTNGVPSTFMTFEDTGHTIGHHDEIAADLIPQFIKAFNYPNNTPP